MCLIRNRCFYKINQDLRKILFHAHLHQADGLLTYSLGAFK